MRFLSTCTAWSVCLCGVSSPVVVLGLLSQIQNCLFKVVGPGLVSTPPAFVSRSASHPVVPHDRHAQKNGKSDPHCCGREGSTQFAQQLESAVTAPPRVGCVVWSQETNSALPFTLANYRQLIRKWRIIKHPDGFTLYQHFCNTCKIIVFASFC